MTSCIIMHEMKSEEDRIWYTLQSNEVLHLLSVEISFFLVPSYQCIR